METTIAINFTTRRVKTTTSNKYVLLTKREVKMAGYCPSSFLGLLIDRDRDEAHREQNQNERGQYLD